jgi:hypothetical protein
MAAAEPVSAYIHICVYECLYLLCSCFVPFLTQPAERLPFFVLLFCEKNTFELYCQFSVLWNTNGTHTLGGVVTVLCVLGGSSRALRASVRRRRTIQWVNKTGNNGRCMHVDLRA